MQDQDDPRSRVCRRLFVDDDDSEPGDRDNILNQINEELKHSLDDACKKYNFDFRTEMPLEGNWKWERINEPQHVEPPASVPSEPPSEEPATENPQETPAAPDQEHK